MHRKPGYIVVFQNFFSYCSQCSLAFEAEPRWVSRYDVYGPCGMVSQWATLLTISANPAVPKLDPNSRAARERALRAELAEDRS